jgi:hypothetical protein
VGQAEQLKTLQMHQHNKLRLSLFLILLCGAVFIFAWVFWPQPRNTKIFTLPAIQSPLLAVNDNEDGSIDAGSIVAELSWPEQVHLGKPSRVELIVRPVTNLTSENISHSAQFITEARLDLPLLKVLPFGGVQQSFDLDDQVYFQWEIDPFRTGTFDGQFWLYVLVVNGAGETDRQAMLAVPLSVESKALFGLSDRLLVWIGWLMILLALVSLIKIKSNR